MHAVPRTPRTTVFVCILVGAAAATLTARGDEPKPAGAKLGPAPSAQGTPAPPAPASTSATAPAGATAGKITITTDAGTQACREQAAQAFLIRGNWFPRTNDA